MNTCVLAGAGQIPQAITVPPQAITLNTTIPFAGSAISRQARRLYVGNIPFGVTEVSAYWAVIQFQSCCLFYVAIPCC